MSSKIRILCVDDHHVVLDGLALLIDRQGDMEVVGAATSGEAAVEMFHELQPDVTLMDLRLPVMSGTEAIRRICRRTPAARIVVLTMYDGGEDIHGALEAGAASYVLKDMLTEDLVSRIREVHNGERLLPSKVAERLDERNTQPVPTAREIAVIQLIAQGLRNKEIAVALGIAEETVKVHVKNILGKLDVSDRSAVIGVAIRRGYFRP